MKKLICVIGVFLIQSCSVLGREAKYVPGDSDFDESYMYKVDSSGCDGLELYTSTVSKSSFLMFGFPLVPLFPVYFAENKLYVRAEGDMLPPEYCPPVLINGVESEGVSESGVCSHDILIKPELLNIAFDNAKFSCEVSDIEYELKTRWGYRPLFVPVMP